MASNYRKQLLEIKQILEAKYEHTNLDDAVSSCKNLKGNEQYK
jgi:hypothetical protein